MRQQALGKKRDKQALGKRRQAIFRKKRKR